MLESMLVLENDDLFRNLEMLKKPGKGIRQRSRHTKIESLAQGGTNRRGRYTCLRRKKQPSKVTCTNEQLENYSRKRRLQLSRRKNKRTLEIRESVYPTPKCYDPRVIFQTSAQVLIRSLDQKAGNTYNSCTILSPSQSSKHWKRFPHSHLEHICYFTKTP